MIKQMRFSVFFAVFLVSGCAASIYTAKYPSAIYPPVPPEQVQILSDYPPNPNSFVVIGEVSVGQMSGEMDHFTRKELKKKVGEMGGSAVVLRRRLENISAHLSTTGGQSASGSLLGLQNSAPALSGYNTIGNPAGTISNFSMTPEYSGKGQVLRYLPPRR
ncbi:MAG: hypothetical protein HY586_08050 [Candidatus Omnitrophica bacterium]|nr:hypothetical protein [Candidatus Omnitrophota bacterium]